MESGLSVKHWRKGDQKDVGEGVRDLNKGPGSGGPDLLV